VKPAAWLVFAVACDSPREPVDRQGDPADPPEPVTTPQPSPATTPTGCAAPGVVCTVLGLPQLAMSNGNEGEADQFGLHLPTGVVLGSGGEVYVADESNHRIVALHPDGRAEQVAGNGYIGDTVEGPIPGVPLHGPSALYFLGGGPRGSLLVTTRGTGRVVKVDLDAGTLSFVAGTGIRGYNGEIAATKAKLATPRGVTVGPDGTVYVSDTGNHLVRSISADGRLVNLAGIPERQGHTGDGGLAVDAGVDTPVGIAIEGNRLYFADSGSHTIRFVDLDTGIIDTFAGIPDTAGHRDNSDGGEATLAVPTGLALDGTGGLLVVEEGNSCVRRIALADGVVSRFAGHCGESGFAGDGGDRLEALLMEPMGVAAAADGTVWLADTTNQVIRTIRP
jgi:sugar lactone lactonase YvrE